MSDPSGPDRTQEELWHRLSRLPSLDEDPLPPQHVRQQVAHDTAPPAPAAAAPPAPPAQRPPAAPSCAVTAEIPVVRPPQAPPRPPVAPPPAPPTVPPAARPPQAPPPVAPCRVRKRRHWARWLLVGLVVLLIASAVGAYLYAQWQWNRIDRVAVADVLTPHAGGPTNWLIVGSDTREGFDLSREDAAVVAGEEVTGQRSDTMMLLSMDGDSARLLSLPRDLWLPIAGTGENGRLNSAYSTGGAPRLIQTVQSSLGLPVHHYAEIDFTGFGSLVDAVGGIDVPFEHPAFDPASGLNVPEAGIVRLDGPQALAFVRSRHYTEIIDGEEVVDGTSDLGRNDRQRQFLTALMDKAGQSKAPWKVHRVASAFSTAIAVDDALSMGDAFSLARRLGSLDAQPESLPVVGHVTDGGAQVLLLGDGAESVLDGFR